MYDVLIIGAGCAGLSAAMYCARKQLNVGIVSIDVGGQLNLTSHIENYPGSDAMSGFELGQKFYEQAEKFGAKFVNGKVARIEKLQDSTFELTVADEKLQSKSVILSFGKVPRKLGIPGEDKFMGRGVSTCAICDAPLYKGKKVVVIGGGNSAFEAALDLSVIAEKVFIVHRSESFRADEVTVGKLRKAANVEFVLNATLTEVLGDKFVSAAKVKGIVSNEERILNVDGIFLEIGFIVDDSLVKGLVSVNERKEIIVNDKGETSCPGIFAAGDATNTPFKQAVVAAGDGCKAALQCYSYLNGGKISGIDWTVKK